MTQPTGASVKVELVGWRNRRGRFTAAEKHAVTRMASVAREVLKDWKKTAEEESPVGKHPFGVPNGYKPFAKQWTHRFSSTRTGGSGQLTNKSSHTKYVLFPTRAHEIRAKRAKVLRFMSHGQVGFARSVQHPGTAGNDVLARVLSKRGPESTKKLAQVGIQIAADIQRIFE